MIKTLQVVEEQHLQGFLIANNNYYSDYSEILLKERYLSSVTYQFPELSKLRATFSLNPLRRMAW